MINILLELSAYYAKVIGWFVLVLADLDSFVRRSMMNEKKHMNDKGSGSPSPSSAVLVDWGFWCKLLVQQGIFWVVFAACGLAVVTKDWNVGYSRKVCHVVMYLTPFLIHLTWPTTTTSTIEGTTAGADSGSGSNSTSSSTYDHPQPQMPSIWDLSWTVWFLFVPFYLQIKPIRRRATFLMLVFRAYDRPQDRPYTLTWLLTQLAGGYVITLGLFLYLDARGSGVVPPGAGQAILIPIVVNVIGDGLAEPVGIRWAGQGTTTYYCVVFHTYR